MKKSSSISTLGYYRGIDVLRFFAAIFVMLFHYISRGPDIGYYDLAPIKFSEISRYGFLGIYLFFIISGFVIACSSDRNPSPIHFIISRISRLLPCYLICVTLTSIVIFLFKPGFIDISLGKYLTNLTLILPFLTLTTPVDAVYWTLFIEISFYFLFFCFLLLRKKNVLYKYLFIWLIFSIFCTFYPESRGANFLIRPFQAPYFITGILIYHISIHNRSAVSWGLFALSSITCVLYPFIAIGPMTTHPIISSILIASFIILVILASYNKTTLLKFINCKALGALSYPLYLIHQVVGYTILIYLSKISNAYLSLLITCLLMITLAYVISQFMEKKAIFYLRNILLFLFHRYTQRRIPT